MLAVLDLDDLDRQLIVAADACVMLGLPPYVRDCFRAAREATEVLGMRLVSLDAASCDA